MLNQQIMQIEETLAHQEQQIRDLNDMVIHQNKEIEKLHTYIQKLRDKIDLIPSSDGMEMKPIEDEKPPHY